MVCLSSDDHGELDLMVVAPLREAQPDWFAYADERARRFQEEAPICDGLDVAAVGDALIALSLIDVRLVVDWRVDDLRGVRHGRAQPYFGELAARRTGCQHPHAFQYRRQGSDQRIAMPVRPR